MSDEAPTIAGLKLEQVAGVHAALNEKLPLEEILKQEKIAPDAWGTGEKAWRVALAGSPDLQLAYAAKVREAEDHLRRPCPPYDDDPAAWAGLTGALATSDGVAAFVAGVGLSMTDFGRLGRAWRRKAEKDPEVTATLNKLAGKGTPPKKVTLEPPKLKPYPWSPKAAPSPVGPKSPTSPAPSAAVSGDEGRSAILARPVDGRLPIETDLDLYAALVVVLELAPATKARALALLGLDGARGDAIAASWRERLKEPALEAEFSVKKLDHRISLKEMLRGARPLPP
ncbi:MAG: hypothetical protein U0414_02435 [Polyangiaceae bacterium]